MTAYGPESCGGGRHNALPSGICTDCGQPAGSVLSAEPYDYGAARRELEAVHDFLRAFGLEQHPVDGEWGQMTGYYEREWDEAGNTVEALRQVINEARLVGLYEAPPGMELRPLANAALDEREGPA